MATMGITTAMAIVPPVDRPPLLDEPDPEALSADGDDVDDATVVGVLIMAVEAGGAVDVIITIEAGCVPPVDAGDCVTVEVIATTDG